MKKYTRIYILVGLGLLIIGGIVLWALDAAIQQGGGPLQPATPEPIDLDAIVLAYDDPLQNIGPVNITQRRVLEDALWWRVNDPDTPQEVRAECFALLSAIHEGNTIQFTQDEEDLILEAVQMVWGPVVIEKMTRIRAPGQQ